MKARQQLIKTELRMQFDTGIKLTQEEEEANSKLLELKMARTL